MAPSVTEDEDIIIFNDEGDEGLEIVNDKKTSPKKETPKTDTVTETATKDGTMIQFDAEEESNAPSEETPKAVWVKEELLNLQIESEETSETKDEKATWETQDQTETNISLDSISSTSDELKEELIEAQDAGEDTTSFEDMGIDLNKLWDSDGENLENLNLDNENAEISLVDNSLTLTETEADTDDVSNIAIEEDVDLGDSLPEIWELDLWEVEMWDTEESHDGILEAAISKLVLREEGINDAIEKEEKKKSAKKDEIAGLKKQIQSLEAEVKEIDKEIENLNNEKKTINKTKEGLEKMKIAV